MNWLKRLFRKPEPVLLPQAQNVPPAIGRKYHQLVLALEEGDREAVSSLHAQLQEAGFPSPSKLAEAVRLRNRYGARFTQQ